MGKIKSFFSKKSIKKSFAVYLFICILAALFLSLFISGVCQYSQDKIFDSHKDEYNYKEVTDDTGHTFGYYLNDPTLTFTPAEKSLYSFLSFFSVAIFPITFAASIIVTSLLFYKRLLEKPLAILNAATDNIAANNLDFKVAYERDDEMGRLCLSFEKMRAALEENQIEMWRQFEERKRLNAAFSHDLRTPLTVLKGESEMLAKYAHSFTAEKISENAETMVRHIARLEDYVAVMTDLQRLEDIEIKRQEIETAELIEQIKIVGETVSAPKAFAFNCLIKKETQALDISVFMRIYENLLENAARYADSKVTVTLAAENGGLSLVVADDGAGFSRNDLANATNPFYKSAKADNSHFGMGLNICKILCEKQNGYLNIVNDNGAKVTAFLK